MISSNVPAKVTANRRVARERAADERSVHAADSAARARRPRSAGSCSPCTGYTADGTRPAGGAHSERADPPAPRARTPARASSAHRAWLLSRPIGFRTPIDGVPSAWRAGRAELDHVPDRVGVRPEHARRLRIDDRDGALLAVAEIAAVQHARIPSPADMTARRSIAPLRRGHARASRRRRSVAVTSRSASGCRTDDRGVGDSGNASGAETRDRPRRRPPTTIRRPAAETRILTSTSFD